MLGDVERLLSKLRAMPSRAVNGFSFIGLYANTQESNLHRRRIAIIRYKVIDSTTLAC